SARGEIDSAPSVRLVSKALRAPRLLLLVAEREAAGTRLRGTAAIDGDVAARAERVSDPAGLVRDLLVRSRVVEEPAPLYRRPLFWIAVGVAAAGAATGTLIAATPHVRTAVNF